PSGSLHAGAGGLAARFDGAGAPAGPGGVPALRRGRMDAARAEAVPGTRLTSGRAVNQNGITTRGLSQHGDTENNRFTLSGPRGITPANGPRGTDPDHSSRGQASPRAGDRVTRTRRDTGQHGNGV